MEMTEIERMNTVYRYKEIAIKDINEFKKTGTYEVFSGKFIKDIKYRVTYFFIFIDVKISNSLTGNILNDISERFNEDTFNKHLKENYTLLDHEKDDEILKRIGLKKTDFGRFRDIWLNESEDIIQVKCRTGGMNRPLEKHNIYKNEYFRKTYDWDFDRTYAFYVFALPDKEDDINE